MYFDIGANLGAWSLANINGTDKIISVEASPKTFNGLVNNCKNHNIIPLNYAVCNNDNKDITFYEANCHVLSTLNKDWLTSNESRFYNQPYTEIICKTIKIDDLINTYGTPSLIKIDVEGGEYECVTSLTKRVDMLCFEWASETNSITFKCLEYLSTLGFKDFYLQFGDSYTFRPQEFYDLKTVISNLENTIPRDHWGMLWCK